LNSPHLYLLDLNEGERLAATRAAARLTPPAQVSVASTIDEVVQATGRIGPELLVTTDPATVERALSAVTDSGEPRFGVILLGALIEGSRAVAVPPDQWTEGVVRVLLPLVQQQLDLARQNASLRGDLATVGRRISHDLRAPLSAIVSAAEVIRDVLEDKAPEAIPFTSTITDAVAEQERTIRRVSFLLKASARMESFEELPMIEPLYAAIQRNEVRAAAAGATVSLASDWPTLRGVSSWLEALWTELIQNAIDHAKVPKPAIQIGWTKVDSVWQFWVENSGPGIPPEKARFFFYSFDQLHRLDAPRGLGLSTVRRLAEISGGGYGYEPRPSSSRFYFTLPAA
jgi:signal transduction histidine kinase